MTRLRVMQRQTVNSRGADREKRWETVITPGSMPRVTRVKAAKHADRSGGSPVGFRGK